MTTIEFQINYLDNLILFNEKLIYELMSFRGKQLFLKQEKLISEIKRVSKLIERMKAPEIVINPITFITETKKSKLWKQQ